MTAIETTALTKRYGDVPAVDGLDLTVESGEVFGFLGPNGAGKSTTIDILLGFQRPTEGSATVLGYDATAESRAVRARTGLLPEGYDLYENLSAVDHLRSAVEAKDAADDPDALLDRVGLAPADSRRPVGGYSTGMRQRLALAVALVGEPDLLVFDEPASGLDPNGAARLREIVRAEADRGATVFFSSHVLDHVERVCDRVGIMTDGALVAVDDIDALRETTGAGTVVEATVASPPDPGALTAVDGVREASVDGDRVRATCGSDAAKMAVLDRLNETTTVRDVETVEQSLEALFAAYTDGERADDTAVEGSRPDAVPAGGERS